MPSAGYSGIGIECVLYYCLSCCCLIYHALIFRSPYTYTYLPSSKQDEGTIKKKRKKNLTQYVFSSVLIQFWFGREWKTTSVIYGEKRKREWVNTDRGRKLPHASILSICLYVYMYRPMGTPTARLLFAPAVAICDVASASVYNTGFVIYINK